MANDLFDKPAAIINTLDWWVYLVDPTDTTDSPQGSDKRMQLKDLLVDYAKLLNKPSVFPTNWNSVSGIPAGLMRADVGGVVNANFSFEVPFMTNIAPHPYQSSVLLELGVSHGIQMELQGNLTLDFTNDAEHDVYVILKTDTSGRTLSLTANKFIAPSASISLSSQANRYDVFRFRYSRVFSKMILLEHLTDLIDI